jgi:transaldolase/glucose-6-phosphate isomerase
MSTNAQITYAQHGQSIWYDNIQKSLLDSGEFARIVQGGVRGCTSNPSIFYAAIAGSQDYDASLRRLVSEGRTVQDIYYQLVIDDIRTAADALFDVFEESHYRDGYVSVEVLPKNAKDTEGTIQEALDLHRMVGRRNVMIKVPATPEGLLAIRELTGRGVPVNVTLIFSREQYRAVANAYVDGLELAANSGVDLERIASVASFFVSRIDSDVDAALRTETYKGKTAIANAKLAYVDFQDIFSSQRFNALQTKGAQKQRVLWASTSTKNPNYPKTYYVDALIGPDTVNTVPPATLVAFQQEGNPGATLAADVAEAEAVLAGIAKEGVDLDAVCGKLLERGLDAFGQAMDELFVVIEARRLALIEQSRERQSFAVGSSSEAVLEAMGRARSRSVAKGIWNKDASTFCDPAGPDAEAAKKSIQTRLGWLRSAQAMQAEVPALHEFAREAYEAGFRKVLLLGMGGSSLCPEVFATTFGATPGFLSLRVLDSTDPDAVASATAWADLDTTLFIVASKSGSTIEVACFATHFWQLARKRFGDAAGSRFVAITDPGSPLDTLATSNGYRRVFRNAADIGGRYSALSFFGLVPAVLMGVDIERLLDDAVRMQKSCHPGVPAEENPGIRLGAFLAGLALAGRNKLTLIASPEVASFGNWIEQLVAESTGKAGKGIVPVVAEPLADADQYGSDRAFVYVRHGGRESTELDARVQALVSAGFPVATLGLLDLLDLGGELYRWEMATAVAGALLRVNPFDEPNVSEAKAETGKLITAFEESGKLPQMASVSPSSEQVVQAVKRAGGSDYVVLSAFFEHTPEREAALTEIRTKIRSRQKSATTLGFGPRFLHSTGQLHKGGPKSWVVLVLTSSKSTDIPVPDRKYGFGVLLRAQALGDLGVLLRKASRERVVHVDLGSDVDSGLRELADNFRRW